MDRPLFQSCRGLLLALQRSSLLGRLLAEWRQVGEYRRNAKRAECETSGTGAVVSGPDTIGQNDLFSEEEVVMVKKVRVTEAKAHLSALMARAGYAGERYLIERRGKPLAALVGVEDLQRLEAEGGSPSSRPRGALALVGSWGEFVGDDEIDAMVEEIYAARERDIGRPVDLEA